MKKQNFTFFYSLPVFMSGPTPSPAPSGAPEVTKSEFRKEVKESISTIDGAAQQVILNIANKRDILVLGIYKKDPQAKEARDVSDSFESVAKALRGKVVLDEMTPAEAMKKLEHYKKKAAEKLLKINEQIDKMDEMKKLCKKTLGAQYRREFGVAQSEMQYLAEGAVKPKRIRYIVEVYLHRWYERYNDIYLPKLNYKQLTALTQDIGIYKRGKKSIKGFKSGKIHEDLKVAYKEMSLLVNNWKEQGENSKRNYKNSGWDGWSVDFPDWKINGERKYRTGPLPDGSDFKHRKKQGFPPTSLADFKKSLTGKKAPKKAPEQNPKDLAQRATLFYETFNKAKASNVKITKISLTPAQNAKGLYAYLIATKEGTNITVHYNAKTNSYKYEYEYAGLKTVKGWKKLDSPVACAEDCMKDTTEKTKKMYDEVLKHFNEVKTLVAKLGPLDPDYKFELQKFKASDKEVSPTFTGEYTISVTKKGKAAGKIVIENDTIKYVSTKPPKTLDLSPHGFTKPAAILKSIKEGKEPLDPKAPKIQSMSYANGVLTIVGEKLPKQPIKNVELPKVIRSGNLVKGGVAYESTAINNLAYGAANINRLLVESVLKKVPDGPFKKELAKSLTDRAKGIPVLKAILATGPKPTLRVIGRASFDGRFAGNRKIARERAENAVRKIEAKLGGKNQQLVKLVPVPEVVSHKGDVLTQAGQLTKAYMDMKKDWNKLAGSKDKKLTSSAQMKKIVSNYINGNVKGLTADQKQFLKDSLDKKRNVQVEVVAPRKAKKFTMKFEKPAGTV